MAKVKRGGRRKLVSGVHGPGIWTPLQKVIACSVLRGKKSCRTYRINVAYSHAIISIGPTVLSLICS